MQIRIPFRLSSAARAIPPLVAAACLAMCGCGTLIDSFPAPNEDLHAPVVAVSSFENRSGFAGQWQLGSGMADLLVSELIRSRNFTVVERQHFEGLVDELQRQRTGLFRQEGKVPIGRMKNARFLVRGVINDFSQTSGGSLSAAFRSFFFLGRGHTARVALTLTVVDIESGQIITAVQSAGLVRTREAYLETNYKGIAFGGDIFFTTPLGKATVKAISGGVRQIIREMPENAWRPMISCVKNGMVILNGGKDHNFRDATVYVVRAPAEPVTDPSTGDVLTYLPGAKVGTIQIIRVDEKISYAKILQGSGFDRGQCLAELRKDTSPAHAAGAE